MVGAKKIAQVMGGERVLGRRIRSISDLIDCVAAGLPPAALESCVERVLSDRRERTAALHRVVPKATLGRSRRRLGAHASERIARLARLIATAELVWGDAEDAHEWLRRPHPELNGSSPLEAATTELGALEAESVLWKLAHGIPA